MQGSLYRREGRDGKTERRKVKEQSTNIPTKLLLGPMHPSQVQSRIPHTHTPHIAAYALPLMPLLYVCVCVWLLPQCQQGSRLTWPAERPFSSKASSTGPFPQNWAACWAETDVGSVPSVPPSCFCIITTTDPVSHSKKKNWDFSRNRWTSSLSSSIFVSTSLPSTVKAGETRCVQWLLCPLCRLCEWGVENKKGSRS